MRRAMQVTKVSRQFALNAPNVNMLIDLPPVDWVVTGPRGGRYLAIGARTRYVGEVDEDWTQNTVTVVDRSANVRYVRPGSRLEHDLTERGVLR